MIMIILVTMIKKRTMARRQVDSANVTPVSCRLWVNSSRVIFSANISMMAYSFTSLVVLDDVSCRDVTCGDDCSVRTEGVLEGYVESASFECCSVKVLALVTYGSVDESFKSMTDAVVTTIHSKNPAAVKVSRTLLLHPGIGECRILKS